MDTLVQADIFFFITSIAIVLVTIATLIALFFLIRILRDLSRVSSRVREQSDRVLSDAIDIKELVGSVLGALFRRKRSRGSRKRKE